MLPRPVYLDHAATTPLAPAAREVIVEHLDLVGNPNSLHGPGRAAHRLVEDSRERLAAAIGVHPSEVLFTSGGTEADNLGIKGAFWAATAQRPRARGIVLTAAEHHAVLDTASWLESHEGARLHVVPLHEDGTVDLAAWEAVLAEHPGELAVATLMWANNEVGTVQPVEQAAAHALAAGIPLHTDAVQALGHVPVQLRAPGIASAAITAHKIGGPVGIGALILGRDQKPIPLQHGGGHERSLRSGTLDAVGAAAFAAAAESAVREIESNTARWRALRERLVTGVLASVPGARLNGPSDPERVLPGTAHFTFPGAEGDTVLFMLDMAGIASSTGSACTAGVAGPSHVLLAMGDNEAQARCVQRFSLGLGTTQADVDALLSALPGAVAAATTAGPASAPSTRRAVQ